MTVRASTPPSLDASSTRTAGVIILLSALASIAAVAMDAEVGGKTPQAVLQSIVSVQTPHQLVHVVAMACVLGLMLGHAVLAQLLGLRRTPVLGGLIAYAMGSMLMLCATVIDGFISTDLAAAFVGKSADAVQAGYWMIQAIAGVGLTDLAKVAWVFMSVAVLLWSGALLPLRGLARKIGVLGLLTGALPAAAVVLTGNHMTATVVVGILLLQALWNLAVALLLMRPSAFAASAPSDGRGAVHATAAA
jgi:hypothetical protein